MKRRRLDEKLKAQVAIEAIRGELTTAEMVSKYKVHANQISKWKKQLLSSASSIFSKKKDPHLSDLKQKEAELYRKVGEQALVIDWLKKKSNELGLS